MSKRATIRLSELRAEVRKCLLEMDTGMPGYGADVGSLLSGGGGYGFMNYGGSLKNIFIDPFVDVLKTTKGVATELSTRAKSAANVAVEAVLSSFIPLYETNYTAIFHQMDKSLANVKKKYEKVYEANDEAFRDKDARFLAFLYDPAAWITAKAAEATPGAVASVLEIFTDGSAGVASHLAEAVRYLKELQLELTGVSRYNRSVPHRLRRQAHAHKDMLPWESIYRTSNLLESEAGGTSTSEIEQKIAQILSDPELKREIESSNMAKQMKADGKKILSNLVSSLSKDINDVNSIKSLEDIPSISGGKVAVPSMENLSPEEAQTASAAAISNIKSGLGEFYKRSLSGAIKTAQSEGVGNDNAYVKTLQTLLQKL